MIAGPRADETKIYWDILEVRRVKGEVRNGWIPEEWECD